MKDKNNSSVNKGKHSKQNQDKTSVMKPASTDSAYRDAQTASFGQQSPQGQDASAKSASSHTVRNRVLIALGGTFGCCLWRGCMVLFFAFLS